jgi:hypothetical protein
MKKFSISLVATLLSVAALSWACSACSKKIYVPVESLRVVRDSSEVVRWRCDSVVIRDSVATSSRGDTILMERWHSQARSRVLRDTVTSVLRDTVTIPKIITADSAKESAKESSKTAIFAALLSALLAAIAASAVAIAIYRRLKK